MYDIEYYFDKNGYSAISNSADLAKNVYIAKQFVYRKTKYLLT